MNLRQLFRHVTWKEWPQWAYKQPAYLHRLAGVQQHLAAALDAAAGGTIRVLSICSGDGRDVLGTVQSHTRRGDVRAWLVEQSADSVAAGARHAQQLGLDRNVHFLNTDATVFEAYQKIAPANIILVCGVWGHVPALERKAVVDALARLCEPGGAVIWTRRVSKGMHRLEQIQSHFNQPAWQQQSLTFTADQAWAIVTHRYCGPRLKLPASGQLFHFEAGAGTR